MANAPTTGTILHRFTNLNTPGAVHIGNVSLRRLGGFVTYCNGRTISFGIGTPQAVTCKACLAKAARNGIDPTEL